MNFLDFSKEISGVEGRDARVRYRVISQDIVSIEVRVVQVVGGMLSPEKTL